MEQFVERLYSRDVSKNWKEGGRPEQMKSFVEIDKTKTS
jgi:hypothetical protein